MIVVADTSVILNLCRVQHENLLRQLFKRVVIPAKVAEEFVRLANVQKRFSGLSLPQWIEVLATLEPFPPEVNQADLDAGEAAAIALSVEQKADALLIDESLGRRVAKRLGIRTIGIVRILIDARDKNLIPSLATVLDRLENEANFWISEDLRLQALKLVGE